MRYAIFWEGHYVGMVEAVSVEDAEQRAGEKYGPFYGGSVEAYAILTPEQRKAYLFTRWDGLLQRFALA